MEDIDNNCDKPIDHSSFMEHVDGDYFIPECAELTDVKTSATYVFGTFILEGTD